MKFRKALFSDIRFWIIIFFVIRLYGITNPPLEVTHSWRQVTVNMVARNFLEIDANILYPRVDDNHGATGIIGMEFPALSYLIYLFSLVFGYGHFYGRLINLIVSSIGTYYFYLLILRFVNSKTAFFSTIFLLSSIWFAFSRKAMPDAFSTSLMIIGMYYGLIYLFDDKKTYIILYFIFTLIGVLSKIPAAYLAVIYSVPFFDKVINIKKKIIFVSATLPIVFIVYWWYFVWNIHLSEVYGMWYNTGKSFKDGFTDIFSNLNVVAESFYYNGLRAYSSFIVFITGLFLMIYNKHKKILIIFAILSLSFILYIFKSGIFFIQNSYYIIPYVPVMALICGYAISKIKLNKLAIFLIVLISVEGIAQQQHDFRIKKRYLYKMELENIANKVTNSSDLIIINGGDNPQELYMSHRKGWTITNDKLVDNSFINNAKQLGAKYLFVNKTDFKDSITTYKLIKDFEFYLVYNLGSVMK
ncbi:MAG: hypothetical protein A2033_14745 [Bacteroidetes bacterium GWA2_31_9]|nr:MAG: hypothetical protein A2033_14745 [Bacteroidetes bacterium GWA2_31_9]